MPSGPHAGPGEDPRDIVEYLHAAGHDLSLEQLERLHRRRLVPGPAEGGPSQSYPRGTAERVVRISQLRAHTRQFDELAWRLWWEGFVVDPMLVRAFLERRALRWDDLARSSDGDAAAGERDVLEDVFFRHLQKVPSQSSGRRTLERGAATFVAFSELWLDLRGHPADGPVEGALVDGPLGGLLGGDDLDFMKAVAAASDDDLVRARRVARGLLALIGAVGAAIHRVYGAGRRDSVGRTLSAMAESSSEQVLIVLLTCELLETASFDDVEIPEIAPEVPLLGFDEYRRLRRFVDDVPGLADLLEPVALAPAFGSSDAAASWRRALAQLAQSHPFAFDLADDLEVDESASAGSDARVSGDDEDEDEDDQDDVDRDLEDDEDEKARVKKKNPK